MTLVATSVVIDYLRSADQRLQGLFGACGAVVCGITRAEILHGARNPADRQRLLMVLNDFGQTLIADTLWDTVGDNCATLRAAGVTVPFADVVIATVAMSNDVELWTRDNQFALISGVLPRLRLFQEPP
jgi:predicted nucleic acid-binding protein